MSYLSLGLKRGDEVIVPSSNLVIFYAGLPSTVADMMIGRAYSNGIPVVAIYEKGNDSEIKDFRVKPLVTDKIEFETEQEALDKLKLYLQRFYSVG